VPGRCGLAQDAHYDCHRAADFSAYHSYYWAVPKANQVADQLTAQNIKRAVDEQR